MAVGNKHLGYKEALNAIEDAVAGHQGRVLLRLPRPRVATGSPPTADDRAQDDLQPCPSCGAPTTGEVCAFCKLVDRRRRRRAPCRSSRGQAGAAVTGRSRAGERVLLVDSKERRYLVTLAAGGEFHTHAGSSPTTTVIGQDEGMTRALDPRRRYTACGRRSPTSC